MLKNFWIWAIVAVIVVGGILWWAGSKEAIAPQNNFADNSEVQSNMPVPGANTSEMVVVDVSGQAYTNSTRTVTFTANGYSPSSLTIGKSDAVVFKNNSQTDIWPASGMHPTHMAYPTKGGCIDSTFDACRALKPGESWSFTFDIAGTWKYHDHLSPKFTGTIVVGE